MEKREQRMDKEKGRSKEKGRLKLSVTWERETWQLLLPPL